MKKTPEKNSYKALQAKIRRPQSRFFGIHQFRRDVDLVDFFSAYRFIFPFKGSLQDYHGVPFPKAADQIFRTQVPRQPVAAYREILWAIARCTQFGQELSEFTRDREKFEQAILLNQFESSSDILRGIEGKFGKSIWVYQNKIASAHVSSDESVPSEVAAMVLDEVRANKTIHVLMHYIRRRIEGATLRDKLQGEMLAQISAGLSREYFKAKIFDPIDSSESSVSSLLFVDSQSSVIDHYVSLVMVLQAATSDKMLTAEMVTVLLSPLYRLYELTRDRRLIGVLNALGKNIIYSSSTATERAAAIEAYTEGNYHECKKLAEEILQSDPLDSAVRLLKVKAETALSEKQEHTPGVCGAIHEHLFNVLSANENFFPSVHALIVLADRYLDHHWMLYFRVAIWYEVGAEEKSRTPSWMRDVYVRDCYMSPFLALTLDEKHSESVLELLGKSGDFTKTIQLVRDIIACSSSIGLVEASRQAKYIARELLSRHRFKDAADLYEIAAKGESRTAARLRALGGQSLALMLDKQYRLALDTLVGAFLECPNAPLLLPFRELLAQLPDADQWPNTMNLGLVLSLASQFETDGDLSKLRLAFEKFCEDNGVYTPSQLSERSNEFGVKNVISYLENVWQPEVMRQTLLYKKLSEIEEARIEACRVLVKIDSNRARAHKEELASRIKQQEISKATALVEQSRVYVDIEAIKRALKAKLKTSYAQYKSSILQHGRHGNELLDKIQSVFEGFDSSASLSTLLSSVHVIDNQEPPTQSDIQFTALFGEITKEFLTGDHGLNAYLSTRVRHGKFVDALRKSVTNEHLVTARHDDGTYVPNVHWVDALSQISYSESIISALKIFTTKFDATLFYVRDKKIQIRKYYDLKAMDENTDGIFQYHFSYLERQLMQSYDADFKDFDELIIKCVDSLWEKTDANLATVREYLSTTLRVELMRHFDELSADISGVCGGSIPSQLSNAIARSRTATQQALDNVVAWFRRSEVYDRQDFDVDFPGQIAASMVSRTLSISSDWVGPDFEIAIADAKLPGRSLDALVDIFYALYENAVKYAELESIDLNIKVSLAFSDGDFRAVVTSTALPPTADALEKLDILKASLATQESRRLAQSEGRSGFRKILLALSSPLYKSSFLDFDHVPEGLFQVKFGFKISEVS